MRNNGDSLSCYEKQVSNYKIIDKSEVASALARCSENLEFFRFCGNVFCFLSFTFKVFSKFCVSIRGQ